MNIAIILPFGYKFCAKAPNSIENVVRTLNTSAKDAILICCTSGEATDCGMKTQKFAAKNKKDYSQQVAEFLIQNQPNLIEVHQELDLASYIAKKTNLPTVLYKHNYIKAGGFLRRLFLSIKFKNLRAVVFVSSATRDDFAITFPQFANVSFVIPNPINLEIWQKPNSDKENIIFFAGRAAPEKGLSELCDGLALALQQHSDWRAILMLNNYETHKEWADCQIGKLSNVASQVEIFKNQPLAEVIKQQSKAKIAIVPSKFKEPFGLVALEAHALLCALISSGSGGLREASGDNAIYLEQINGDAIYAALNKLISNPNLCDEMAQQGRLFVENNHNVPLRVQLLNELRAKILKGQL